jgi:ABC-type transport system involved in cytochrome c biogenesis permease subunit
MTLSLALATAALATLTGAVGLALASLVRGLALTPVLGGDALGSQAVSAPRWLDRAPQLLVQTATLLLAGSLVSLAITTGRAPWASLSETAVAFAAAVLGAYLFVARVAGTTTLAGPAALLAAVLVGFGLATPDDIHPLQPALQQPLLLTVHVGAAIGSYGIGGVAFLAAVAELVQRATRDAVPGLPTAAAARRAAHAAVLLAFPLLTAAIVLGSVWANLAWRSYWNNDPKELAAAATWLVYAAELHLAGRRDRWGDAAPWLLVLGFAGVLFTWLGAGLLFIGQHSYATG